MANISFGTQSQVKNPLGFTCHYRSQEMSISINTISLTFVLTLRSVSLLLVCREGHKSIPKHVDDTGFIKNLG